MRRKVLLLLTLLSGMAKACQGKNSCKEMSCYVGQNNAPKAKWRGNTAKTRFLGNKDYVSECEAACLAYTARGGVECKSFVWFDEPPKLCMMASSCWALQCHAVITDDWAPVPDDARAAVSGYRGIAATSMLNKAVTSVADGVVAGVVRPAGSADTAGAEGCCRCGRSESQGSGKGCEGGGQGGSRQGAHVQKVGGQGL
ncbi:MAG: hypothetical protein ACPIOQ_39675 [Promethearchaeia archaeon]